MLCQHMQSIKPDVLDCVMQVIRSVSFHCIFLYPIIANVLLCCSEVLSIHRKNKIVCCKCIELLDSLLPYVSNTESDFSEVRENYVKLVSGFW